MRKGNVAYAVSPRERTQLDERFDEALDILASEEDNRYIEFFERIVSPSLKTIDGRDDKYIRNQTIKMKKDDKIQQLAKCITCCNNFAHFYEDTDLSISRSFFNLKASTISHLLDELEKDNRKKYPFWGFDDSGRFFIDLAGYGQCNWHIHKQNIDKNCKEKNQFKNKRVLINNSFALDLMESFDAYASKLSPEDIEYNQCVKRSDWPAVVRLNAHKYKYNDCEFSASNIMCPVNEKVEKYNRDTHGIKQTRNMCIVNVSENENGFVTNIFGVDSSVKRQGELQPQYNIQHDSEEKPTVVTMAKLYESLFKIPNINKEKIKEKSQEELFKFTALAIKKGKQYIVPISCNVETNRDARNSNESTYVGGHKGKLKIAIINGKDENVQYKDFNLDFQQPKAIENVKDTNKQNSQEKIPSCTR